MQTILTAKRESARTIETPDVAKLIRKQLKAKFPDVTFSVRSRSYAGGSSIDISYTDGPTCAEVTEITRQYSSKRFDGMQDLSYSVDH